MTNILDSIARECMSLDGVVAAAADVVPGPPSASVIGLCVNCGIASSELALQPRQLLELARQVTDGTLKIILEHPDSFRGVTQVSIQVVTSDEKEDFPTRVLITEFTAEDLTNAVANSPDRVSLKKREITRVDQLEGLLTE